MTIIIVHDSVIQVYNLIAVRWVEKRVSVKRLEKNQNYY